LLDHFGLKPRTIALRQPAQNGDVESSHGGLKRALRQHLLLRGWRDFASLADYEAFVGQMMNRRNQGRQSRLAEELVVMKPLRAGPLQPYQEVRVKVNRNALIRVQANLYSVPTHLIGQQVRVRIYEWQLEVYYRQIQVERMARIVGNNKHAINYRHVIDSLLRKPGGFRNYRYREEMFPGLVFRQCWDQLNQWYSARKADLIYLRILRLAARTLECDVAEALQWLLTTTTPWDETDVEQRIGAGQAVSVPQLSPLVIDLTAYDQLLAEVSGEPT
jgi:hypothetical protein